MACPPEPARRGELGTPPPTRQGFASAQGRVKHRMKDSVVELFQLTATIPAELAEQFPPSLYINELKHRSEVILAKHVWARCSARCSTEKQATKLQLLSDNRLVAIIRLQHCELILVPETDSSNGDVRMAGFLALRPPGEHR